MDDKISVAIRVRPLNEKERKRTYNAWECEKDNLVQVTKDGKEIPATRFTFGIDHPLRD